MIQTFKNKLAKNFLFAMRTISSTRYFSSVFIPDSADKKIVFEKIMHILRESPKCDKSKLCETAKFSEIGFDSLDVVELVVAFEESLGFDLPNEIAEKNFESVTDILNAFAGSFPVADK